MVDSFSHNRTRTDKALFAVLAIDLFFLRHPFR
jgi:hypothetical protein